MLAACGESGLSTTSPLQRLAVNSVTPQAGAVVKYTFTTIDNRADPNFNELLGINNESKLVGFYGRGGASSPNRGYVVYKPYGPSNFKNVNYPHSVDTQVSAVNNKAALGGWYSDSSGQRFGFMELDRIWYSYWDANASTATKLLAINDSFLGVGYYVNPGGRKRAFEVDISTDKYTNFNPPRAVDAVATGITGRNDVAGWLTLTSGKTLGWLWRQGSYTEYSFPRSETTKFLGVTLHDWIVGSYVDKAGATHGFLLTEPLRPGKTVWQKIDEPDAVYGTVVTGINIHRDLVGYYVERHHHTHGFLAVPASGR
jgi:hypothetical protein